MELFYQDERASDNRRRRQQPPAGPAKRCKCDRSIRRSKHGRQFLSLAPIVALDADPHSLFSAPRGWRFYDSAFLARRRRRRRTDEHERERLERREKQPRSGPCSQGGMSETTRAQSEMGKSKTKRICFAGFGLTLIFDSFLSVCLRAYGDSRASLFIWPPPPSLPTMLLLPLPPPPPPPPPRTPHQPRSRARRP